MHSHFVLKLCWENEMKWKNKKGTATKTTNSTNTTNNHQGGKILFGGLSCIHGYTKWKLSTTKVAKYYCRGMYCIYRYTEWRNIYEN